MSRAQCTDAHARGTTPACHLGPLFLPWGPRAELVRLSPWPGMAWHRDRDTGQEVSEPASGFCRDGDRNGVTFFQHVELQDSRGA